MLVTAVGDELPALVDYVYVVKALSEVSKLRLVAVLVRVSIDEWMSVAVGDV